VFRSEKVDLAEITEKLENAVQHYSGLTQGKEHAPQSPGIAGMFLQPSRNEILIVVFFPPNDIHPLP